MSESAAPEVVLLTRPGCHLCEDARLVLQRVGQDLGVAWQERSADDAPELAARFGEEIPVLFIDGIQRDFWTIDETRLRRLLEA
ncbi:glutaredoxin family protein [Arthrobacter zhangbolii]|uniref:Glutaredoxin family protein n=1 Tax=Arthrobacter zhangbolii TaxID=2886936 RepID=A0A9X1M7N7_9MICC|nr:glutaredoxin family protein [Arthrobacter zhangbolii]MCC3272521.1 glutaredoxin family protein [Arthrobacter zhangbolii]MCC3293995.1 glutaredoxin family protein [Arthrobacter zhangbolii]UON91625.1 glutaredoxin family protein [Arthrobacter zhangbolii]